MAFVQKILRAVITIGVGKTFVSTDSNSVELVGYRMQANITTYGLGCQGALQLRIYGVTQALMNQLTMSGPVNMQLNWANSIMLAAGDDDGAPLTTVFIGGITHAWGDYSGAPECCLTIIALSGMAQNIIPVASSSFQGAVSADTILKAIVAGINAKAPSLNMGYSNPDNAVNSILTNAYLPGSGLDQISAVCKAAFCNFKIEQNNLVVWPIGAAIATQTEIPNISPNNNMVGYPTFNQNGITLKTIFMPTILIGQQFTVSDSQVTTANGAWCPDSVVHTLESITPGGAWFTDINAHPFSLVTTQ